MKAAQTGNHDAKLYSRVEVLESSVGRIEASLIEFTKEVREWMKQQQSAPHPIPFKEIMMTVGATLAVVFGILNFLDSRFEASMSVYKYRVEQLEQRSR